MVYIVFDLETIVCRSEKQFGYIVEIGAVKIKEKEGRAVIVDSFHTYVRPPSLRLITQTTLRFIGASMDRFETAPRIYPATRQLKRWINEENYYLCGWSDSEQWLLAKHNTREKKMDLSWVKNYNDIQPVISKKVLNEPEIISLEKALRLSGSRSEEGNVFHSAIVDAFSTTSLFIRHFEEVKKSLLLNNDPFPAVSSLIFKNCRNCKETKHHTLFRKNKCKVCHNKDVTERRKRKQEREDALYTLSFEHTICQEEK